MLATLNNINKVVIYREESYLDIHATWFTRVARDYEVRERIPHKWVSSNDSFFQSNFSAWSYCAAILRKTPDWSVVMT